MGRLAVIIPSRGLVFSETVDETLRELKDWGGEWKIYWAHGRPIPECFNEPTERALKNKKNTHFWFVEEDMGLPKGVLKDLFKHKAHAVACDYPVTTDPSGTILRDPYGKAYFTGCGCLLVTRETLEFFPRPIWRSDIAWNLKYRTDFMEATIVKRSATAMKKVYGHQDINFGLYLYAKGRPIEICDHKPCWQRKVEFMNTRRKNFHGVHGIKKVDRRVKVYAFPWETNLTEFYSQSPGDMLELWEWREGERHRFFAEPGLAAKLLDSGDAFRFEPGELVINGDLDKLWESKPSIPDPSPSSR